MASSLSQEALVKILIWALEYHTLILFFLTEPL